MFDPPLDAPPVLVALAIVALTTVGLATAIAPTPPTDASRLAGAVDRVAASPVPTATHVETSADSVRLTPHRIWTRGDAGPGSATFATGPVTPVRADTRLARVLAGAPPHEVFQTPVDFEVALRHARSAPHDWHEDPAALQIRRVSWEGIDGTLVGV